MSHETQQPPRKPIRSFVKREGRVTVRQQKAIESLWDKHVVQPATLANLQTLFPNTNPTVLEIGFGMGDSLLAMAKAQPDVNFVGVEVHRPGVGSVLAGIDDYSLGNLKVCSHDAFELFDCHLTDASIDKILILFPDPWHKKKHHKRRLINADFINMLYKKLKARGRIHVATDWAHYAEEIREAFEKSRLFELVEEVHNLPKENPHRIETKFERRGKRLGHAVVDLFYVKL